MKAWLNNKLNLLGLVAMLACFDAQAKLFNAESFVLDNGLEVVVVPNHRAPIIKQMLWYKTGSVEENIGKGGSAHLLEHLMFRGTKDVKGQDFNRLMEENGVESNAFTAHDVTSYHQFMDISRLELAMYLEADRMQNLIVDDKDFALERDIVFQERKQRIDNNPLAQFGEEIRRVLWQNSPYGRPVSGTEEEILSLNKKDIEDYYKSKYQPQHAILVLSGDIEFNKAQSLVQKYYGEIKPSDMKYIAPKFPVLKNIKARVEMTLANVHTPRLMKVFATSSYNKNEEDVYPLQVLAAYMGEGETSKLYKKLVLQNKRALSVNVDYNPLSKSYGIFTIAIVPVEGVEIKELEKELKIAWDEALQELSLDEIQNVRQKMLAGLVYLKDNPEDTAYVVGAMRSIGVSLDEIEKQAEKIHEVDYHSVRKAAKRMISEAPQVTGILNPQGDDNAK